MNEWVPRTNIRGPEGIQGEQGEIGPPNILTVGTVSTVLPTEPAAVEITGTSPEQVINFEIPQGPPGPGAEGINKGTGAEVFAGADAGTGIMEFWRVRGTGVTTTSVDASGVLITTTVTWGDVSGKPATFPPTLPIAIADVTGLTAQQAAQDTAIGTKLNSSAYTAADVLAKLLTVDGASSGLDADLLDGQSGAYYLAWANFTGKPSTFPPTLPITQADVTNLTADLALKAPLASPALTGNPTAPTPAVADNDTSIATTAFCKAAIAAAGATATVAASAPGAPVTGTLWWNTTRKELTIWTGAAWEVVVGTWA